MSYRHVIKRFPIDRLHGESAYAFALRADLLIDSELHKLSIDTGLELAEYSSNIYHEENNSRSIRTIVAEIYEVPAIVHCEDVRILVFRDEIKREIKGDILDIDYDEAIRALDNQKEIILAAIAHVKKIQEELDASKI